MLYPVLRSTLKRATEVALAHGGPAHLGRLRGRARALILAYHNVLPEGEAPVGERSLHLPLTRFREHLEHLARHHEVVPLPALLDGEGSTGRRPRVAITFDDAYHGALSVALPELV